MNDCYNCKSKHTTKSEDPCRTCRKVMFSGPSNWEPAETEKDKKMESHKNKCILVWTARSGTYRVLASHLKADVPTFIIEEMGYDGLGDPRWDTYIKHDDIPYAFRVLFTVISRHISESTTGPLRFEADI
jgi:hypothetical protein